MTKICRNRNNEGCGLQKPIEEFRKNRNKCKQCELEANRKYYEDNKEKELERCKKYKNSNKEKLKKNSKIYYENNKEKRIKNTRDWENKNREKVKLYKSKYSSEYYENNKDEIMKKYYENIKSISETKIKKGYKGDDYIFYTLKFYHKTEDIIFYKYGITKDDIKTRYKNYKDYNYEIIDILYGDKEYIKSIERKHLQESKDDIFEFPAGYKFPGKTECRKKLLNYLDIIK